MLVGEPKGGVRSQRPSRLGRLFPSPVSRKPPAPKSDEMGNPCTNRVSGLRMAHSTRRKAQPGLHASDAGSLHHPLGFEGPLHSQGITRGQAIVRIVRRPHPPEAPTMATIPARTASARRCQTAASSATSGAIASASISPPSRSARSALAPATPPSKTALLWPPYPVAITRAGRQRLPEYGGGRPR
jgi:hypothetical protein